MGPKSTLRLMRTLGPSLASLAQSSWSLLSNALRGRIASIPHPKPYKLQWLHEQGEMIVNQHVKVPFSIETYKDAVNYDIVPMEAGIFF